MGKSTKNIHHHPALFNWLDVLSHSVAELRSFETHQLPSLFGPCSIIPSFISEKMGVSPKVAIFQKLPILH